MVEPRAYYNEHDKYAAAWLRNLIAAGHIAPGDVDERDIRDVRPDDLRRYVQCHFFAGVGVWSHSLRRAGWPDRRPVWTASCPCQPFSAAGQGGGFDDERHLWPAFFHLVEQCRPRELFGEQVASKDGLAWLDLVQSDMEGEGYAFGALDMCAAGFGAPHIRQRLYWMAYAEARGEFGSALEQGQVRHADGGRNAPGELADADDDERSQGRFGVPERRDQRAARPLGLVGGLGFTDSAGPQPGREGRATVGHGRSADATGGARGVADADGRHAGAEREQRGGQQRQQQEDGRALSLAHAGDGQFSQPWRRPQERNGHGSDRSNAPTGPVNGIWRDADWLLCRDGKWRPVRSGTFPLAHGAAARVGRLRAYGNAIVAPQAEEFIGAYLDVEHFRLSLTQGIFA